MTTHSRFTLVPFALLSLGLFACSGSSEDASTSDDSALVSKGGGQIGVGTSAQGSDPQACRNNLVRQAGYICRATGIENVTSDVVCADSVHHTGCTCHGNVLCKPGGGSSSGAGGGGTGGGSSSGAGGGGTGGGSSSGGASGAPPAPTGTTSPTCFTNTQTYPATAANSTCGAAGGTVTEVQTTCYVNNQPQTTTKTSQSCIKCTTTESCQPINGNEPDCAAGAKEWCVSTTTCSNGTTSSGLPYCK